MTMYHERLISFLLSVSISPAIHEVIAAICGRRWTVVQLGCMIGGVRVTMPRGADELPPSAELS
jgi:hypothetical protein